MGTDKTRFLERVVHWLVLCQALEQPHDPSWEKIQKRPFDKKFFLEFDGMSKWDTSEHTFSISVPNRNGTSIVFSSWEETWTFLNSTDFRNVLGHSIRYIRINWVSKFVGVRREPRYTVDLVDGVLLTEEHIVMVAPPLGHQYDNWYSKPYLDPNYGISFSLQGDEKYVNRMRPVLQRAITKIQARPEWKAYAMRVAFNNMEDWSQISECLGPLRDDPPEKEYLVSLVGGDEFVHLTAGQLLDPKYEEGFLWNAQTDSVTEAL